MKEYLSKIILGILIYGIGLGTGLFFSCQTAPIKDNYDTSGCFQVADGGYRKIGDSAIAILAQGCNDSRKEKQYEYRAEVCKNKYQSWGMNDQEKCRYYLNGK